MLQQHIAMGGRTSEDLEEKIIQIDGVDSEGGERHDYNNLFEISEGF